MNNPSLVLAGMAALLLASPVTGTTPLAMATPAAMTVLIESGSLQWLNAGFLKSAVKGQILVLSIDGKSYQYRVTYRHFDGEDGELRLELGTDPSRAATFGIRGSYVSAFIQTPLTVYALGYAGETAVIGKASTAWTTPSLAELPQVATVRIAAANERPPVAGATAMTLDTRLFARLKPGEEIAFALPGLGAVRMVSASTQAGTSSTTWAGYLADFGKAYTATITWNDEGMSGYIVTPQGDFTVSRTTNRGTYIWNPTALGLKHGDQATACAAAPPPPAKNALALSAATPQATLITAPTPGQNLFIDILIYYTKGMITKYGSVTGLIAVIDNYIALTNQAYAAGGLMYQLRLTGLKPIDLSDQTDNQSLLSQLTAGSPPFSMMNSDRAATGADLVSVIRPFHADSQLGCGIAWVGGGNQDLQNFPTYKPYMMSVLSDGVDLDRGTSYCDQLVLAHETGHNLGLAHDHATVASQAGMGGTTPFAYGYAVPNQWGTIMSYTYPHLVRFSDASRSSCGTSGTEPCGIQDSADNVKALGLTMPLVSAFFGTGTTVQASVQVVEFYNTKLDNYFISADANEAAAIDSGSAGPGWSRTGNSFKSGGNTPVCRFYGSQWPGPNSHFYTADPVECEKLKQMRVDTVATQQRWSFESLDFVSTPPSQGSCPAGTQAVYRAYNNGYARGVDSNHRITTSAAAIQQVVNRGWSNEGVVMCAPL